MYETVYRGRTTSIQYTVQSKIDQDRRPVYSRSSLQQVNLSNYGPLSLCPKWSLARPATPGLFPTASTVSAMKIWNMQARGRIVSLGRSYLSVHIQNLALLIPLTKSAKNELVRCSSHQAPSTEMSLIVGPKPCTKHLTRTSQGTIDLWCMTDLKSLKKDRCSGYKKS